MSVTFSMYGTASSGCQVQVALTDKTAESLTQNLDWIVVMEYPAIRSDGSWRYYSDQLPTYTVFDKSPNISTKMTCSIARRIIHYPEQPRRVVESGKLIMNIYSLTTQSRIQVSLPDVWFTNSSKIVTVPVTKYLVQSKVLFVIRIGFANGGLEWDLGYIKYGNLDAQRDRDVDSFQREHIIVDGPLV